MTTKLEDLKLALSQILEADSYRLSHAFGDDVLEVPNQDLLSVLKFLKTSGRFDFLMDICEQSYPAREKRFDVVYHLFSSLDGSRLRIKAQVSEGESIDSAIKVWRGADWFEREAYDMFGLNFSGHPNLRRILTHHQFVGHPLRKDYEADAQQHCDTPMPMQFDNEDGVAGDILNTEMVPINIGPSHPAMHGTLRVMAELDGETIVRAGCEIGYLHRCFEKMAETHPYNQVIPYTDRLNYCSAPMNNVGYCKAVEKLLGVEIPPKAQAMRVILCELSRIMDHTVSVGTGGVDFRSLDRLFPPIHLSRESLYAF